MKLGLLKPDGKPRRHLLQHFLLLTLLSSLLGMILKKNHDLNMTEEWTPAVVQAGKPETVLVFVGSSTCRGSNHPDLPEALRRIRTGLRTEAKARGETFASIGVSVDMLVEDGVRYLRSVGPFDEIMTGRSWANSGSLKYLDSEELGGPSTIPQMIVLERVLARPFSTITVIAEEEVLFRTSGGDRIVRWSKRRFPDESSGSG